MNEETTDLMTPQQPQEPPPRRLLRSRQDRMLAGVAGGLGRYFNVDPVIFRIGFVIATFFGGFGIAAYVALALFTGDDAGGEPPIVRSRVLAIAAIIVFALVAAPFVGFGFFWAHGSPWGALWLLVPIGIGAAVYALVRQRGGTVTPLRALAVLGIVLVGTVGMFVLAALGAFATATGHGLAAAIVVAVLGVALVVASFLGGARWLIAPALALAIGVGGAAAANLKFHGGIGDREYHPATVAAIPADGYHLGIGRLAVDLRGLEWKRNTVVDLKSRLGMGEEVIVVPSRVCIQADAHAGAGQVTVAGVESSGF